MNLCLRTWYVGSVSHILHAYYSFNMYTCICVYVYVSAYAHEYIYMCISSPVSYSTSFTSASSSSTLPPLSAYPLLSVYVPIPPCNPLPVNLVILVLSSPYHSFLILLRTCQVTCACRHTHVMHSFSVTSFLPPSNLPTYLENVRSTRSYYIHDAPLSSSSASDALLGSHLLEH